MHLSLKNNERKFILNSISFIDIIYPQWLYNYNRFFNIFFVILNKKKQAFIAHDT
ncbi:MAG: hypothetical protein RLZZ462_1385 [Bacteroidota bacterium]|jgi:hypothetical protein